MKKYLKMMIYALGLSLILTNSVSAFNIKNNFPLINNISNNLETKNNIKNGQVRNFCNDYESMFFWAETKDFWVNICGGDLPHHYVGVSKKNVRNSIRLELTDYDKQGRYFQAKNGKVIYEIIMNTTKGSFLLVTEGNKQLVRQPLIYWE